jgi:hypothetical protein
MDPRDPSMFDHEVTSSMPLAHLYQLAHEQYAEVSLSIQEIVDLKDEYGWDYPVEATVKIYRRPESIVENQPLISETMTTIE